MSRLPRPYIPLKIKLYVAGMQLLRAGVNVFSGYSRLEGETRAGLLERRLVRLADCIGCARSALRLDHDPALENREFNRRTGKYKPDANDQNHLFYRDAHSHHIKTHVRGEGARRSDTAERMHWRKVAKNKAKRIGKRQPKQSRPIQGRSTWAKGRKIENRKTFQSSSPRR